MRLLAVAWPIGAFICGLYAIEDLRSWSSGVSAAPKLLLCSMLLSWPLFTLMKTGDIYYVFLGQCGLALLIGAFGAVNPIAICEIFPRMAKTRDRCWYGSYRRTHKDYRSIARQFPDLRGDESDQRAGDG